MENLCDICPRECHVNRNESAGFCQSLSTVRVAKVMLHYFEEPIISGEDSETKKAGGSGAIFFSNCNLRCVYCQNQNVSNGKIGKEISTTKLAEIFKMLENAGANNINLVTPTHFTDQIIKALDIYHPNIPIVWNTSSFEKPETIKKLKGYVDIFLADFKYMDADLAKKYSFAPAYPEFAKSSILEMRKIQPDDVIQNGLMKKGLIIRHLVLPNHVDDSVKIIDWINENLGNKTFVSLMSQYVPFGKAKEIPEISRKLKPIEYKIALNELIKLGFKNAFTQDITSATDAFTPDFESDDGFDL